MRLFDSNPALVADAKEIGAIDTANGFGDARSMAVRVNSLKKEAFHTGYTDTWACNGGYLYVAIPVDSANDAKWISASLAMSDGYKPVGGILSLTCVNDEGKTVEVSPAAASALDTGWASTTRSNVYRCQWILPSFNIDKIVEATNKAHEKIAKGEKIGQETESGPFYYEDPGTIKGIYAWENSGKTYLIAKIGLMSDPDASIQPTEETTLYIDDVAAGKEGSYTGAYTFMSGTSMATPAITGCMAVIAKGSGEKDSAELSDAQLELQARERAAKLLASVEYDDALSKLCRTGGRVDLTKNEGFTRLAPYIQSATSDGHTLAIKGYFFNGGSKGDTSNNAVAIDGQAVEASKVTKWRDESISVSLDGLNLTSGPHVVKLTNSDGAVTQVLFSHSNNSANDVKLYEREHKTPTYRDEFQSQDRLWGAMVACGDDLYAMSATLENNNPQSMWRYSTKTGEWSYIPLPENVKADGLSASLNSGCLVECGGSLYFAYKDSTVGEFGKNALWRYDADKASWYEYSTNIPGNTTLCSFGDRLFLLSNSLDSAFTSSTGGAQNGEDSEQDTIQFALFNTKTGELTKVKGYDKNLLNGESIKTVASDKHIYCAFYSNEGNYDGEYKNKFYRLTYDEASNKMSIEDLSAGLAKVAAPVNESAEESASKAHFAIAGLPDGMAIVGSSTLGEDTYVLYDETTTPVSLGRTSSFHTVFDPLACYCDGYLYAYGANATESDVLYFRSTHIHHSSAAPIKTTATYTSGGVNTFVCDDCGQEYERPCGPLARPDEPEDVTGKTYQVGGNTYLVTDNTKNTVSFVKSKKAKTVIVPAKVKINGKTYKVNAIGAKAFANAKKKLKTVVVKTKSLTKKSVKSSLKGSSIKTVKVKVGKAKANKKYAKKYAKYFKKANSGKKVTVKAA